MIATLKGILSFRYTDSVVVDVGGIGYKVTLSQQSLSRLPAEGQPIFLFIYTSVREDDISLFGFLTGDEKKIFQKLITVNGIGPKLALNILSGIHPEELVESLRREDLVRLTAIPGVGKKTAERMILDLKDKLTELLGDKTTRPIPLEGKIKVFDEALSALINLGYTRIIAEKTLSQIDWSHDIPLDQLIRRALKTLS